MIKINYPADIKKLKENYLKIFDINAMESKWASEEERTGIKLVDLLTGDFTFLVDVFLWYKSQIITDRQKGLYESIFDYEAKQPDIAAFFMDDNNGFDLSTCHYCNMAYINKYNKSLSYSNRLDFVNNASISEWREYFHANRLSDQKLKMAMEARPYANLAEFNKKNSFGKE